MKVKEVRELLNKFVEQQPNLDEFDLAVELSEHSIGRTANAIITAISAGFDWDSGLMFLHTKERLIKKK